MALIPINEISKATTSQIQKATTQGQTQVTHMTSEIGAEMGNVAQNIQNNAIIEAIKPHAPKILAGVGVLIGIATLPGIVEGVIARKTMKKLAKEGIKEGIKENLKGDDGDSDETEDPEDETEDPSEISPIAGFLTWTKKTEDLPNTPGVYIVKDDKNKVLYLGKAKKLKRRIRDHLDYGVTNAKPLDKIWDSLEIRETSSIEEAEVLESKLLQKLNPPFNIEKSQKKKGLKEPKISPPKKQKEPTKPKPEPQNPDKKEGSSKKRPVDEKPKLKKLLKSSRSNLKKGDSVIYNVRGNKSKGTIKTVEEYSFRILDAESGKEVNVPRNFVTVGDSGDQDVE